MTRKHCFFIMLIFSAQIHTMEQRWSSNLHQVARDGDMKGLVQLLDWKEQTLWSRDIIDSLYCFAIDDEDANRVTPLHEAVAGGHLQMAQLLTQKGANINAITKNGITPLHLAADRGHFAIVQWITLQPEVNVNAAAAANSVGKGATPLHMAMGADSNTIDLIQWLIEHGADKNATDMHNLTPLHYAAAIENLAAIQYLLKQGTCTAARGVCTAQGAYGATPLHLATDNGNLGIVQELVQNGKADIDAQDGYKRTSSMIAEIKGHHDISQWFAHYKHLHSENH